MDFTQARRNMVDCQLRTYDVTDRALLVAMDVVPRERFVPAGREAVAYLDQSIELDGYVFLAPMVLGRMVQALRIETGSKVLDVGAGLGYTSGLLVALGAAVTGLNVEAPVRDEAVRRLAALDLECAQKVGALPAGLAGDGPFDAILINGAVEVRPDALLRSLTVGGRLACLHREGRSGRAVVYVKASDGFSFTPLFDSVAPVLTGFRKEAAFSF